jgi:Na+-translocating ferredoxin:NAD+ oxidoreductase RnfG subunit
MNTKGSIFLVLAALVMVVGIFAVNAYTSPMIEEARVQRENALYFDVVPEANGFGAFTPLTTPPQVVRSMVTMTQSGEDYVLVYDTTFKGWNDGIRMLFFVYADRLELAGVRLISHDETVGIGDRLLENRTFQAQFQNLTADRVFNQGLDQIAGTSAPVTQDAVEEALIEVLRYHQEFILGEVEVDTTPPEIRILSLPTTFNEGTIEPNWEAYFQVTNKDEVTVSINRGSLNMNQASDTPYVITATFTDAFGNSAQAQLSITIVAEEEVIEIINIEPSPERSTLFNELFPTNTQLTDLTETLSLQEPVTNVYRISQDDTILSVAYEATVVGFYRNTPIRLLLFVNLDGTINRLVIVDSNSSEGWGRLLIDQDYLQGFQGLDVNSASIDKYDYEIDFSAGATDNTVRTRTGLQDGIVQILEYHATQDYSN